ncbi:hypothetical protein H2248_007021 [Termitomyces sp. 'cryptogamus']|nr:hypothetical protein H2248_007021 [Termitomyces sp. 'cryptogamus']
MFICRIGIAKLGNSTYRFENFDMDTVMLGASINPGDIETASGNLLAFKARAAPNAHTTLYPVPSPSLHPPWTHSTASSSLRACTRDPGSMLFGQTGIVSNVLNHSDSNVSLAMVKWVGGCGAG